MHTPHLPLRAISFAVAAVFSAFAAQAQNASGASAGTLSTVTVEASADASAAGLTKPYAGGQVGRGGRVGLLGTQDLMNTPFSTVSYTNELIQDQQAQSVADVLRNDPSVRQARGFGNFQELYVVRGFPVFSDDIAYNGLYGMLPRQYIASEFFERVEVFHGASSFLNGATPGGSGIGGAVNLLPKRAPSEALTRIGAGIQTGGQGYLSADIARRFGPDQSTGVRLNAVRREGGTGIDNEKRELSALALGLDWRGRNARLSADIGWQDHTFREGRPNLTPSATLPIPVPPDADSNYAQPWTNAKERDTFATVRGEFDFSDSVTAWAAAGTRRGNESNVLANPTLLDALGNLSSYRFDNVRKDTISTGELGLRAKFETGPVKHTLSAAFSAYDGKRRNAYGFSTFGALRDNLYAHVDSFQPALVTFGGDMSDPKVQARDKLQSVALADTLSFAQDAVQLTLGVRRQSIEQHTYNYNTGAPVSDYDSARNTPMAALLFKPSKDFSLYANYIEALIPGQVAPTTTTGGVLVRNAGEIFPPFRSKQKEIGLKYDGGTLGAGVSLFEISQPMYFVQNGFFGANGEQRNRGLELTVFGQPAKGLRLLGGLSLLDAEQRRTAGGLTDGNDVIGVPGTQFNLGAEWELPWVQGLAVNAQYVHTGKQYANAANTQTVPAWNRLDIGARYLMDLGSGRMLTLRARIDNLLDKSYWASAGGTQGSNYLVMGTPRTFALSATVDF